MASPSSPTLRVLMPSTHTIRYPVQYTGNLNLLEERKLMTRSFLTVQLGYTTMNLFLVVANQLASYFFVMRKR